MPKFLDAELPISWELELGKYQVQDDHVVFAVPNVRFGFMRLLLRQAS